MRSDVTENKKSTLSGEKEGLVSRTYLCMDLKSFYASVECADRDLDPLTTNLVVADPSRTEKTICLAVSPSLKAYGISGRARLFEVIEQVRRANVMRKKSAPGGRFTGSSVQAPELAAHPEYQIDYLIAPPRMAHYMEVSTRVYDIYLKYAAPEDIHVYSIDEVFMDLTNYLPAAGCTAREYAKKIMKEIFAFTGLTATAGIGTNLYLAKIAMDIEAKHIPADEDGTRIAMLDEISYRRKLWIHQPITDFYNCPELTTIETYGTRTTPSPVDRTAAIVSECFNHSPKLTVLKIPASIAKIGISALNKCQVKTLILPVSVKALDFNAFGNAVSLDEISLMSPTMVTADYYPVPPGIQKIRVPQNLVETYKQNKAWKPFAEKIVAL